MKKDLVELIGLVMNVVICYLKCKCHSGMSSGFFSPMERNRVSENTLFISEFVVKLFQKLSLVST